MGQLNEWLDVSATTSDAQRRARFLNILLVGCTILCLATLIGTVIYQLNKTLTPEEAAITYWAAFAFLLSAVIVFLINRYWSGKIAAWLFLLILTFIIYFADTPYESTWGRNMITMIIPVLAAGAILRPSASFIVAGLISVIFYIAAVAGSFEPNFLGAMTFFAIALVSWLSSRTLERALQHLRHSLAKLGLNEQRLQILHTIDLAILSADSLQDIAQNALSSLCELIPSIYAANVLTFDYETNRALILTGIDRQKQSVIPAGSTIPIYDSELFQRLRQGELVYNANLSQHHELDQAERQIREAGVISYLIIPLLVEEQLVGALYLSSGQTYAFTEQVLEIGREVASQLAIAIRQAQLRQQAEQNLAELEHLVDEKTVALRLRNRALESSTVGVTIADARQPDMPLIYVNPAFTEITGYSADEVIGRNCRFLQGSGRNQPGLDEVREAIREERDCRVVLRNYKKDGTPFYNELTISPVRDASGEVSHFIGIASDVSRRQQTEAALRQSEETLRIMLNATEDIALLIDTEGQIQLCNEPVGRLLNKPIAEIMGTNNVYDLLPPNVSPLRRRRAAEVIASGQPVSYEETFGDLIIDNFVYPIADGNGRVVQLAIFGRNVTERKRAEANLRQALAQEKELNQLKSRFVSMTSHEFRTPLTTILSSVGLLEHANGAMPPERQLKHYNKVRTAVNHMTGLLDDVLLIGKAENGRLEFRPEPLDIKQLCQDIFEEMQLAVKETHRIHFTMQFEQEQLLLDGSLMRQMLTNLLSNAIKYSPQGGDVTFSLTAEAGCLVLRVRDEGIGIPERDRTRLFDAFHRASNVSNISGTGLGLAIVHNAATLHGGTVHFTSEEGRGTEFVVEIPLGK